MGASKISEDTKRLDWLSELVDVRWAAVCRRSKKDDTLRQAIDAAMFVPKVSQQEVQKCPACGGTQFHGARCNRRLNFSLGSQQVLGETEEKKWLGGSGIEKVFGIQDASSESVKAQGQTDRNQCRYCDDPPELHGAQKDHYFTRRNP